MTNFISEIFTNKLNTQISSTSKTNYQSVDDGNEFSSVLENINNKAENKADSIEFQNNTQTKAQTQKPLKNLNADTNVFDLKSKLSKKEAKKDVTEVVETDINIDVKKPVDTKEKAEKDILETDTESSSDDEIDTNLKSNYTYNEKTLDSTSSIDLVPLQEQQKSTIALSNGLDTQKSNGIAVDSEPETLIVPKEDIPIQIISTTTQNEFNTTTNELESLIKTTELGQKEQISTKEAILGTIFDSNDSIEEPATQAILADNTAIETDKELNKNYTGAAASLDFITDNDLTNISAESTPVQGSILDTEQQLKTISSNADVDILKDFEIQTADLSKAINSTDTKENTTIPVNKDTIVSNNIETKSSSIETADGITNIDLNKELNIKKVIFETDKKAVNTEKETSTDSNSSVKNNEIKLSTESSARLAGIEIAEDSEVISTLSTTTETASKNTDSETSGTTETINTESTTDNELITNTESNETNTPDENQNEFKQKSAKIKDSETTKETLDSTEYTTETTTEQVESTTISSTDSIDDLVKIAGKDIKQTAQTQVQSQPDFKEVTKSDVLNQLNDKFAQLRNQNNGKVEIILKPENLGKLNVEIQSIKGAITATLIAENSQVKEILEKNIETLKNNMNAQGLNVNNVNVKVDESAKSEFENMNFEKEQFAQGEESNNSKKQNSYPEENKYRTKEDLSSDLKNEGLDEGMVDEIAQRNDEKESLHKGSVDYKV